MVRVACPSAARARMVGSPQAIETVFPQAQVQLCIVHLVRASLNYVSWTESKQVAQDLKAVYRAATAEEERQLSEFAVRWDAKYATIAALSKISGECGDCDDVGGIGLHTFSGILAVHRLGSRSCPHPSGRY
jgi:hypothetical protein